MKSKSLDKMSHLDEGALMDWTKTRGCTVAMRPWLIQSKREPKTIPVKWYLICGGHLDRHDSAQKYCTTFVASPVSYNNVAGALRG